MASAQGRNAKAQRLYEEMLPEVKTTNSHQVIFRNDWKDFVAKNQPSAEAVDAVVLARADEILSILVEDQGPIDQIYSIVILSSEQMIDEGAEVDWIQT